MKTPTQTTYDACRYVMESPYVASCGIRSLMQRSIDEIIATSGICQIIELPQHATQSLVAGMSTDQHATLLSTAIGICGWSAWSLADRIRDRDSTSDRDTNECISLSFIFLLIMTDALRSMSLPEDVHLMTASMIGVMEQANLEESEDIGSRPLRPRQMDQLGLRERASGKSIAVCIPLIASLAAAGVSRADWARCIRFFTYFLRARQLSDDALDWREDMSIDRRTLATQWILERSCADSGIDERMAAFDHHVSRMMSREIARNIRWALHAITGTSCFKNISCFRDITDQYLRS